MSANFIFDLVDRREWLQWDWAKEAPNNATRELYSLFSNALHTPFDRGVAETNQMRSSHLAPPEYLTVRRIDVLFGSMLGADRHQFRENYMAEFVIGRKMQWQAPLIALPPLRYFPDRLPLAPDSPLDFREYPRVIPSEVFYALNIEGQPFALKRKGKGLKFCGILSGPMEFAVQ